MKRRRRGRPPRENAQFVVDLAAALAEVFALGPQQARDVALAWLEGEVTTASRLPRHAIGKPGLLLGHRLPETLEARSRTIRRSRLKPRPAVVPGLAQVRRARLQQMPI